MDKIQGGYIIISQVPMESVARSVDPRMSFVDPIEKKRSRFPGHALSGIVWKNYTTIDLRPESFERGSELIMERR
jgi:hypothetical protein